MKVIVPENLDDVTLKQYLSFKKLSQREDLKEIDLLKRKVTIFTGISNKDVKKIVAKDLMELSQDIDKALNKPFVFKNKIVLNGVKYGFIPNFDKISFAEYIDLREYSKDIEEEKFLDRLMAILYRPISKEDSFGNYLIEKYNGTDDNINQIQEMPISVLKGAMGFFLNLQKELLLNIQRYTQAELMKEIVQ